MKRAVAIGAITSALVLAGCGNSKPAPAGTPSRASASVSPGSIAGLCRDIADAIDLLQSKSETPQALGRLASSFSHEAAGIAGGPGVTLSTLLAQDMAVAQRDLTAGTFTDQERAELIATLRTSQRQGC
jgi:hypothetical protein